MRSSCMKSSNVVLVLSSSKTLDDNNLFTSSQLCWPGALGATAFDDAWACFDLLTGGADLELELERARRVAG